MPGWWSRSTRVCARWIGLVPLVRGANGVLELPVGTIERSGTAVGDLIALEPAAEAPARSGRKSG